MWFSVNEQWENTANKNFQTPDGQLVMLDREGTMRRGGGLVRIGVAAETAPHDWNAHKLLSGVDKRIAKGLYDAAVMGGGKPGEWYVTYEPVPVSLWLDAEKWDEAENLWVAIDPSEYQPQLKHEQP